MTWRRRVPPVLVVGCVALSFAGAVALTVARDRIYGEPSPAASVLYVRSGDAVRRASLSYAAVMADVYWIRTLQYFGSTRLSRDPRKNFDLLYPLLDITTTLDPRFRVAYRFGAIFLAETYPGGAGRPDLAVKLLQKAFREDPSGWRYLQDIGFVYYWWVGDFREAAVWFEKSAQVPGAPWWMKSMAAVTLAEGGDRRSSRLLWQSLAELADSADNEWLRDNARLRLLQLDAMDEIDRLDAIVGSCTAAGGVLRFSWQAVLRAGCLPDVPVDPTGVPYLLDPATGHVTVARKSRLFPLPTGKPTNVNPR